MSVVSRLLEKQAGNFSADERKKVSIRQAGIFYFYFYDKESGRKCVLKMAELFRKENSDARYI